LRAKVKGLRNDTEYWKLHWLDAPGKRNFMSPPDYYPTESQMLKDLTTAVQHHMDNVYRTGRENHSFFWLWNMAQTMLQKHGFFGDVLPPEKTFGHLHDAKGSAGGRRRVIFKQGSADELASDALNAFGMEQAANKLIVLITVEHLGVL
jgi:hypothetical protein